MLLRPRTYRDDELYRILCEVCTIFNDAQRTLDFKTVAVTNSIFNTVWALVLLSFRLRWLCESILSCADYYSACVLHRAFIEHAFKHNYIYVSCIKGGDTIGTEYVSCEHMSHEMLQKLLRSNWPDAFRPTGDSAKLKEFAEFKKRARATSRRFTFAEMTKTLLEMLNDFHGDRLKEMLRGELHTYSTLSSYVHAGPVAVLDLEQKPKQNIDMSSILWTMVAYSHTVELLSSYPSEYRNTLEELKRDIHERVDKALAIYEKCWAAGN